MTPGPARLRTRLEETQLFASARSRRRFVLHAVTLVLVFVVASVLVRRHMEFLIDAQSLRSYIMAFGPLAPLALIVLQAAQVIVAPVHGQVLTLVAGYLFGGWWGTLYTMLGITVGSTIAFWLSRRYGRRNVEDIVHDDALEQFDAVSEAYGAPALLLCFLVPGLPDDVNCFAGGLTDIPLWHLLAIAIVGRAPGSFLVNVVGDLLRTDRFAAALVLAAGLVVLSVLGYRYRDELIRAFGGYS